MLVISYNPGYQHILKDLKPSTRQRFVALEFGYPPEETETDIVTSESGLDRKTVTKLVSASRKMRSLADSGLDSHPGTRMLVHAATLIRNGLPVRTACEAAIVRPLTDDEEIHRTMMDIIEAIF